jgi:hypothetical protein
MWFRHALCVLVAVSLAACGEEDDDVEVNGTSPDAGTGGAGGGSGSGGSPGSGGTCGGDVDLTAPTVEAAAQASLAACRETCASFEMCDVWPAEGQTRADCEAGCTPDEDERATRAQALSAATLTAWLNAEAAFSTCLADLSCDDLAGWVNAELDVSACAAQLDAVSATQQAAFPCEAP